MTEDTRTPRQHMADVASHTLHRLVKLHDELGHLAGQLDALAYMAPERSVEADTEHLRQMAAEIRHVLHCGPESVRDVASALPIRGLDFEEWA